MRGRIFDDNNLTNVHIPDQQHSYPETLVAARGTPTNRTCTYECCCSEQRLGTSRRQQV